MANNSRRVTPRDSETRPHVELSLDDSQLKGKSSASPKPMAIIGPASSGKPNKVYKITSLNQAKKVFGAGALFDAIELAWQPNNNTFGAGGVVYATRIEDATPAKLEKDGLTFTSQIFGEEANAISVSFTKNPLNDSYVINVTDSKDGYSRTYDNLGRVGVISYDLNDKTGGSAKLTVTKATDGVATQVKLTLVDKLGSATTDQTVEKVFDLQNPKYDTMFGLLQGLSVVPGIKVNWVGSADSQNIPSNLLDAATDLDITKPLGGRDTATLWAVAGDIVQKLKFDTHVNVEADVAKPLPATFETTKLQGGSTGQVPISWADKFHNLDSAPFYYLVPLTDSSAIHAEAVAYVNDRYNAEHNAVAILGGGLNETVQQAVSRANNLRSSRALLNAVSGSFAFQDGRVVDVPAYMVGAAIAGIASSLPIGSSVTYKTINLVNTDQNFTSDELDALDLAGVVSVTPLINRGSNANFRITDDPTTANGLDNTAPVDRELGLVELRDFLFDDLRYYLADNYIGETISAISASQLADAIDTFLYNQSEGDGYILSYDQSAINVTLSGNTAVVTLAAAPRRTLKNINGLVTFTDYIETANGATTNNSRTVSGNGRVLSGDDNSSEWTATSI